jgi:hypothetical protein
VKAAIVAANLLPAEVRAMISVARIPDAKFEAPAAAPYGALKFHNLGNSGSEPHQFPNVGNSEQYSSSLSG